MDAQSPTKRRALASLDANAQSPRPSTTSALHAMKEVFPPRKRAHDEITHSPLKRACVDPEPEAIRTSFQASQSRDGSSSPPASEGETSIFDTSAGDFSWATTATEPDLVPVARRRVLTREQAREKVDILRARLGLASYKVRTGQTNVSLADLEKTVLPSNTGGTSGGGTTGRTAASVTSSSRPTTAIQVTRDAEGEKDAGETDVGELGQKDSDVPSKDVSQANANTGSNKNGDDQEVQSVVDTTRSETGTNLVDSLEATPPGSPENLTSES